MTTFAQKIKYHYAGYKGVLKRRLKYRAVIYSDKIGQSETKYYKLLKNAKKYTRQRGVDAYRITRGKKIIVKRGYIPKRRKKNRWV